MPAPPHPRQSRDLQKRHGNEARDVATSSAEGSRLFAHAASAEPCDLLPGVSVIIPSFQGRSRITSCLRSLADQSLDPERFEIIVTLNGPGDGTAGLLDRFHYDHPDVDLKVLHVAETGASRARNAGIAAASRQHTTFVDDDDSVSPGYLETLLTHAAPGLVPFAQIVNVDGAGGVDPATSINLQTISHSGRAVHPELVPRTVGFNACKLIPTIEIRDIAYDTELYSGVDVVFFMTLLAHHDFNIYVCPVTSGPGAINAVYYRLMRPNSMSRRTSSFKFNVIGRLEVMKRLTALIPLCDERRLRVLRSSMSGQASFINRYLEANPGELRRVLAAIESYDLDAFPYRRLANGLARNLVVSSETKRGSTRGRPLMAMRVIESDEIVDVVHDGAHVGAFNPTARPVRGLIDRQVRLGTPRVWPGWSSIERFCLDGLAQTESGRRLKTGYEQIRSGGSSPAAHLLAAAYKLRRPTVVWNAEMTPAPAADRRLRKMSIKSGGLLGELLAGLADLGIHAPATRDARLWGEYMAFTLADTLVFADEALLEQACRHIQDRELSKRIRAIARVEPLPAAAASDNTYPDTFRRTTSVSTSNAASMSPTDDM